MLTEGPRRRSGSHLLRHLHLLRCLGQCDPVSRVLIRFDPFTLVRVIMRSYWLPWQVRRPDRFEQGEHSGTILDTHLDLFQLLNLRKRSSLYRLHFHLNRNHQVFLLSFIATSAGVYLVQLRGSLGHVADSLTGCKPKGGKNKHSQDIWRGFFA